MVEEEGVPGGWKTGVRVRSGVPLAKASEVTHMGATGGGVDGGGEGEAPFGGDGDVGSGICSACACGSGLSSGSGCSAGLAVGSGEAARDP